jgi:tryptophanyl-tRNA synthetase
MKKQLAEDMVLFIKPIREKASDLLANPDELHSIIKQGADKGRARAAETLKMVRDAVGLNY